MPWWLMVLARVVNGGLIVVMVNNNAMVTTTANGCWWLEIMFFLVFVFLHFHQCFSWFLFTSIFTTEIEAVYPVFHNNLWLVTNQQCLLILYTMVIRNGWQWKPMVIVNANGCWWLAMMVTHQSTMVINGYRSTSNGDYPLVKYSWLGAMAIPYSDRVRCWIASSS